jgi:uncharacterized membrane protein
MWTTVDHHDVQKAGRKPWNADENQPQQSHSLSVRAMTPLWRQAIGMVTMPEPTLYHRLLGWHAPALRQGALVFAIGAVAGALASAIQPWQTSIVVGWDVTASAFLIVTWPIIIRADGAATTALAQRTDPSRYTARFLLLSASVASLGGVGTLLYEAGRTDGAQKLGLVGLAVLTVVLSWTLVNTAFTLRYAHLRHGEGFESIGFTDAATQQQPSYRDFVYVAFTIGMTYQVSDTPVGDPRTRRAVLTHALISYLFGVVIVGGSINLIASLVR